MPKKKQQHDDEGDNQKRTPPDKFRIEVPHWVVRMVVSGSWTLLVTVTTHIVLLYR